MTVAGRLAAVAALLLAASCCRSAADTPGPLDRKLFVSKLRQVRAAEDRLARIGEGHPEPGHLTEAQVIALLGRPDDVLTAAESSAPIVAGKVLCYGTNGHRTFPTLGQIVLDERGELCGITGGWGTPPGRLFSETQLREVLRAIHPSPDPDAPNAEEDWDPAAFIRVVNCLQGMGKQRALTALGEYARVSADLGPGNSYVAQYDDKVFALLAVLFPVPPGPRLYGWRHELLVVDDIPFLAPPRDNNGDHGVFPSQASWYQERGRLRTRALRPSSAPLGVLATIDRLSAQEGSEILGSGEVKRRLRNQLLRLLRPAYVPPSALALTWGYPSDELERRWLLIRNDVSRLRLEWKMDQGRYVAGERRPR